MLKRESKKRVEDKIVSGMRSPYEAILQQVNNMGLEEKDNG